MKNLFRRRPNVRLFVCSNWDTASLQIGMTRDEIIKTVRRISQGFSLKIVTQRAQDRFRRHGPYLGKVSLQAHVITQGHVDEHLNVEFDRAGHACLIYYRKREKEGAGISPELLTKKAIRRYGTPIGSDDKNTVMWYANHAERARLSGSVPQLADAPIYETPESGRLAVRIAPGNELAIKLRYRLNPNYENEVLEWAICAYDRVQCVM